MCGRYPTYADWLQYKTKLPRFVFVFLAALVGTSDFSPLSLHHSI
jgi:hypothetical protein